LRGGRGTATKPIATEAAATGETLWSGTVAGRKRRRSAAAADEERNRVFAFLFGVPLELSDDVSPRPPVVVGAMVVCSLVFLALLVEPDWAFFLALHAERVSWVTPLQLVTSVLMHWDLLHLAGNLYFLYVFGRAVEARLGSLTTFGILAASGLAGGLAHLLARFGETTPAGGASGAVAGVLGAYFILFPARLVGLSLFFWVLRVPAFLYLGLWLVYEFLSGGGADGVAHEAHIGGFLSGALVAVVVRGRTTSAHS
jgi:membrane associated rhomboid family serine protease